MPVHEGSHASTTSSPIVWKLLGCVHDFGNFKLLKFSPLIYEFCVDFLFSIFSFLNEKVNGASFYTWIHQHFLGHHPFTNVTVKDSQLDSIDPDVVTGDPDIRRIKPSQAYHPHYRFQKVSKKKKRNKNKFSRLFFFFEILLFILLLFTFFFFFVFLSQNNFFLLLFLF